MAHPWEDLGFPVIHLPPSAQASPETAVHFLVGELVLAGRIETRHASRVVDQILRREKDGSTSLGRGIALPHSKSDAADDVLGLVGIASDGIPWPGRVDDHPVRVVCVLVTPASQPGKCLRALAAVSQRLRGDDGTPSSNP